MTVTMNAEERQLYESRPFKAYDAQGNAVYFNHLVDLRQSMEMHGLTAAPPGTPEEDAPSPFKDYDAKSSEAVIDLCIQRNVVGYLTLSKAQQIEALRDIDRRDEAARKAATDKAAKGGKKGGDA